MQSLYNSNYDIKILHITPTLYLSKIANFEKSHVSYSLNCEYHTLFINQLFNYSLKFACLRKMYLLHNSSVYVLTPEYCFILI